MAVVDSTGVVQKSYQYDVYGEVTGGSGTLANEFDFAGQQTDGTGLQYLRARYYDPETGTFLSRDPLAILPGWTGQPHGYSASPVVEVDPSGMTPVDGTEPTDWAWVADLGRDEFRSDWVVGRGAGDAAQFKHCWLLVNEKGDYESGCGDPMSRQEALDWLDYQVLLAAAVQYSWLVEVWLDGLFGHKRYTLDNGQDVTIPKDYVARVADNGQGIVFQRPGAIGNADSIRVTGPNARYPNGYVRIYNSQGQPVDLAGKPGPQGSTHHPLGP